jgi:co-chaperonin GroES (HSP10)
MITPLLHRVLIKPDTVFEDPVFKRAKAAGLAFAQGDEFKMEENRMDTGVVTKIGDTAFRAYMKEGDLTEVPVKVGDKVSFAKYAGKVMMDGDTKYIVLNDEDIVAVIGDNE